MVRHHLKGSPNPFDKPLNSACWPPNKSTAQKGVILVFHKACWGLYHWGRWKYCKDVYKWKTITRIQVWFKSRYIPSTTLFICIHEDKMAQHLLPLYCFTVLEEVKFRIFNYILKKVKIKLVKYLFYHIIGCNMSQ